MATKKLTLNKLKKLKSYPYYWDKKYVYDIQATDETNYCKVKLGTKFTVDRVVLNKKTKEVFYDITVYNHFGTTHVRISKAVFCKRRFVELLTYGINYNPVYVDNFLDYVSQCADNAPHKILHSHLGWSVEGNTASFLGYDDCYIGDCKLESHITCNSKKDYFDNLNTLIKDSIGCQLAVCISLSSALFAFYDDTLNTGSPIFHFYGDSSSGKSTALILAASMWGNPKPQNKIYNSWNSTANAMIDRFNNNHGVALCFDEAGIFSGKDYTSIIYSISQGVDKSRYSIDGVQKTSNTWCTAMLSSGENSLLEKSRQNSGLRVRAIEFLDLPITKSDGHSKDLKKFCRNNYGILGKRFVYDFCNDNAPKLEAYNAIKNNLDLLVGTQKATDERILTIFAVVLETAERLKKFLSIDTEKLTEFLVNYIKEIEYNTKPLCERAYSAIMEWISNNAARINCYNSTMEKHYGAVGEKYGNTIIIKAQDFRKLLFEAGFVDVNVVAKSLKNAGLLQAEGNGLMYRYTFEKTRVDCYRIILKND